MCGLVGIAGDLRFQDEFTMKRLLLADYFRGTDSTGLAAIRTNGDAAISKIASNPIDLFGVEMFKKVLNGNASRAFIGHNRAATRGGVSTVNAHPFQVDHIIGVHNGTLDKESVKALQEALGEEFAVDSLALFAGIARLGAEKTIKLCNEGKTSVDGAWALVWFNQEDGTLNFLRNKHRPLWFAYEEDFKRMFWASEYWMIREACASSAMGYKLYTKPGTTTGFFPFEEDTWYRYDLAALKEGGTKKPKPKARKLKGKEPAPDKPANFTFPNQQGFKGQGTGGTHGTTVGNHNSQNQNSRSSTTTTSRSDAKRLLPLIGNAKHPYANIIDEEKFAPIAKQGCAWCGTVVKYGDLGITIYERDGRLLCRTCSGVPEDDEKPAVRIYVRGTVIDALT